MRHTTPPCRAGLSWGQVPGCRRSDRIADHGKGPPMRVQFTLRQLLWWVFVVSVFFGAWKTTDRGVFAAVLAISIPIMVKLVRLDSMAWRSRHKNTMLEDLWVMVTMFYLVVVLGILVALLEPIR